MSLLSCVVNKKNSHLLINVHDIYGLPPYAPQLQVVVHDTVAETEKSYFLSVDHAVFIDCLSYTKLLAYVKKHGSFEPIMIPPTVNTDNEPLPELDKKSNGHVVDSVGEASLASDLSEQANNAPSDFVACESGVNPPPVAVSSYPAASDTPYKNMQSQRLGAAL